MTVNNRQLKIIRSFVHIRKQSANKQEIETWNCIAVTHLVIQPCLRLQCCSVHTVQTCHRNIRFYLITRMWANAQRDGRPVDYRWRALFNVTKFGWHPLLECRAVMKPRRKTRWNLLECPKQPNRSQPLARQVHHIVRTCGGDNAV